MYSYHSRSRAECHPVTDKDLIKFSNTEIQFLKWIQEWERRIFLCSKRILQMKSNCYYSCNVEQMNRMETYIKSYQNNNSNVIGQDRFVWTVFANALIKKHKYHIHTHDEECSLKLCLYLLLWSSYYLKLPNLNQVQELVREIMFCARSLKFLFSFLPGMSMTSYISGFISENCDENVLCDEFFFCIEEDFTSSQCNVSLYQRYSSLLFYFVSNLTSLHHLERFDLDLRNSFEEENNCSFTLFSLLNKPVVDQRKQTLLTLAVQNRDEALITLLLQIGASANIQIWDPITEDNTNAEQLLISSVNSLVASKYFFADLGDGLHPMISSVMKKIDSVTVYAHMMRRSLLSPSLRKADNVWRGEGWRQELNSEIADKWGVDYKRPFPSLQHITKVTIRQQILQMDRKLLPIAILELPLPNMLKYYLNLTLD